jgi:small subunit ribosomal protein S1
MDNNEVAANESAQPKDLSEIQRKDHFTGKVVRTTLAGALVDIGLEKPGVVHISQLQEKPTNRVEDVVEPGQTVEVWVRRVDAKNGRVELTMVEPPPLEWRDIEKGMVVEGKVTRLEKFGAFVDIGAERPGLVHISEMAHGYIKSPQEVAKEGDEIEVQVLDVNRRKKQIKLSIKALQEPPAQAERPRRRRGKGRSKPAEPTPPSEPVPTAMEIALREAMERTKSDEEEEQKEKPKKKGKSKSGSNDEMDEILARTLERKVKSK